MLTTLPARTATSTGQERGDPRVVCQADGKTPLYRRRGLTAKGIVRVGVDGASPTLLPTEAPAIGRPALDPVSWTVYVQTRKNGGPVTVMAIEP